MIKVLKYVNYGDVCLSLEVVSNFAKSGYETYTLIFEI